MALHRSERWPGFAGIRKRLVSCGIFELELLVERNKLLVIDLNPRSFGFMSLDIARGSDLPWLWFQSTMDCLPEGASARPLPVMHCRQSLPFYVSRLVMLLSGPNRLQKMRGFWNELGSPWVSMNGQWRDPVPKLLALLRLLRHPGGLVRPYWDSASDFGKTHESPRAKATARNAPAEVQTSDFPAAAAMDTLEHLATGAYPRMTFSITADETGRFVRPFASDGNKE